MSQFFKLRHYPEGVLVARAANTWWVRRLPSRRRVQARRRGEMSRRCVTRSMAVALAIWWLAPAPLTGQEARPASGSATVRTPWGDPDLQGIWSYATITPLERPATLAEREFLTAEEVSEQNQREAGRASSERRAELTPDRDLALAYNAGLVGPWHVDRTHIIDRGSPERQTATADARGPAAAGRATGEPPGTPLQLLGGPPSTGALHDLPTRAAGAVRV